MRAAYFQATYDPEKARIERKKTMPRHVEYCRRPEYREKKSAYDKRHHMQQKYGEFWEAARLLVEIDGEILSRITRPEIAAINGTQNKSTERKRDYARQTGNPARW